MRAGGGLEGNLRALKIAVIVMGVLIIVATAVLIATMVRRQMAPSAASAAATRRRQHVLLDEPAGTRIGSVVPVRRPARFAPAGRRARPGGADRPRDRPPLGAHRPRALSALELRAA